MNELRGNSPGQEEQVQGLSCYTAHLINDAVKGNISMDIIEILQHYRKELKKIREEK